MRVKRITWSTYFQCVAVVAVLFLTWCYLQGPVHSLEPPPLPSRETLLPTVPPPVEHFEPESVGWLVPKVQSMKQELVAWINGIATYQEVEALNVLRRSLDEGRDALSITRELHKLRPAGWKFCVQEGEVCHCEGGWTRYGDFDKDQWVERHEPKSPIHCSREQYGLTPEKDISPGKVKYCQCKSLQAFSCPDGRPYHAENCPEQSEKPCRAGCMPRMLPKTPGRAPTASKLCQKERPDELIWSCQKGLSLKPPKGHKHSEAEDLLQRATEKLCEDKFLVPELEVWLECDFLEQFRRWTTSSPWLEEAYVTYVGGPKNSPYEWQATNLIRSVDLFSSRPLVVVIFGNDFVPPSSWISMRNVIVFRMRHISRGVSFNFNKVRSILAARTLVGIQLDTDQLIFKGMDVVFEATRRESSQIYPWPILPVHWMSRDETPGNPYAHYAFKGWDGPQSMRWNHAHPTWSFWALIFFGDLLHERMLAATGRRSTTRVSDLGRVNSSFSLRELLKLGEEAKVPRHVEMSNAMWEDEDMMNVNLWRHAVSKAWCKFDLEPNLFLLRKSMDKTLFFDPKWYPEGVPVLFLSMHNTKNFDPSDWLLHLLEICKDGVEELECPNIQTEFMLPLCRVGVLEERQVRSNIREYSSKACCCLEPRWSHPAFWRGQWYKSLSEVPKRYGDKERRCLIP